jgi:putative zinc finger/helix-turn-helix YgiT family protein
MKILCINCAKAYLERASVRLSGEIRKHPYTVNMEGLKCPNCGYSTVESKSMVELGRLAADEYRRAHGLLTGDEIVALRHKFGDSQDAFAKRIGVGVASIKRWELGKIQDRIYNDLILSRTVVQSEPAPIQVCNIALGTMGGSTSNVGSYSDSWPTFSNSYNSGTVEPKSNATYNSNQCSISNVPTELTPMILILARTASTYAQSSDLRTENLAYARC